MSLAPIALFTILRNLNEVVGTTLTIKDFFEENIKELLSLVNDSYYNAAKRILISDLPDAKTKYQQIYLAINQLQSAFELYSERYSSYKEPFINLAGHDHHARKFNLQQSIACSALLISFCYSHPEVNETSLAKKYALYARDSFYKCAWSMIERYGDNIQYKSSFDELSRVERFLSNYCEFIGISRWQNICTFCKSSKVVTRVDQEMQYIPNANYDPRLGGGGHYEMRPVYRPETIETYELANEWNPPKPKKNSYFS